uniref:DUF2808 domain-containing protein n=1 Tax=Desertifilum tharense IPPAS B-1220 TaxID=1781255 RepID=A0ACD5GMU4_9CYAN
MAAPILFNPRLLSASTSFNTVNVWHASYDFTLDLPENAGEPLQRVTIALREGEIFLNFSFKKAAPLQEVLPGGVKL